MTDLEVIKIKQREAEEERKLLAARDLGQAVKQRLKDLRWVQQDLAAELNTSQSVVSSIIAGTYLLTLDLITRLAQALKINPIKLASYYWINESQEVIQEEENILENIRDLIINYYQIGGNYQPEEVETAPAPRRPFVPNERALESVKESDQEIMRKHPKKPPLEADLTNKSNNTSKNS